MPAAQNSTLLQAIIRGYEDSGCAAFPSTPERRNPRKFVLVDQHDAQTTEVWIYAWTLTPGGRPSLPYEYRIQMTSVGSPLDLNPAGPTLLLGYKPDEKLFAGFDLAKHRTFKIGSPSVQIDIRIVREALAKGLSFGQKENDEIAIGIGPNQLLDYTLNAAQLHRLGSDAKAVDLLRLAVDLKPLPKREIKSLSLERMRVIQTISRLTRDASFRHDVLSAYDNQCAVTGVQLQLVDAAHILPVGAKGSSDDVRNGICLSPTYHRAYDLGIIYMNEKFTMLPNPPKLERLRALNLAGGEAGFFQSLGRLHLPTNPDFAPSLEFIRRANAFRGIQSQ